MTISKLSFTVIATLSFIFCHAQANKEIQGMEIHPGSARQVNSKIENTDTVISNSSKALDKSFVKTDSAVAAIQNISTKYFRQVDKKIDRYTSRVTSKTEKTLIKLSKWENKIKKLLDKASPETSTRLFSKNQITFSSLLKKLKEGESVVSNAEAQYDGYRDKLTTNIKYIQSQRNKLDSNFVKPVVATSKKVTQLNQDVANSEAIEQIIKERKKQLINESIKYIGNSKYFTKINKESYYYVETLRNYKEIFSDKKKAEQTALSILNKIPAFQKFKSENSLLASLFGNMDNYNTTQDVAGLQTRFATNDLIQNKIAAGGPNAKELMQQGMQQAQAEMNKVKDKVLSLGGSGNADDIPSFKPNQQKSKTFFQRIEYAGNYQFNKSTATQPFIADIALSVGYKLNDKSIVGIGATYKLGFGKIESIKLSQQGIGFRSFADWKWKKQFFVSGGFEMNYSNAFSKIPSLKAADTWQESALFGITKKLKLTTKLFKASSLQIMYDFLYRQHIPISQPVVFRVGYSFK